MMYNGLVASRTCVMITWFGRVLPMYNGLVASRTCVMMYNGGSK